MFSWFKNDPEEDTVAAKRDLDHSDKDWQKNLNEKGLDSDDRAIEMNKNYKALTNYTAQELRDITCTPGKSSPRGVFNNDALEQTKELLDSQTNATNALDDKDEVINTLEEERSKKRGWFW